MALLRYILICFLLGSLLTGCHFTYLVKGGYYQAKILIRQEKIEAVLEKPNLKPDIKHKLQLAQEVLKFIETDLGLETKGNYRNFVQLDDRYVSYAVTASEKFKLQPFLWRFPIVGEVPYKGYFVKSDAEEEANKMKAQGYDTLVRGVSAYSTLGWIRDPILSSMVNYRDEDFVNLLIHETVHANLYIKNASDFNEQLATFLANKGAEAFYKSNPVMKTSAIQYTKDADHDERLFSKFISEEIKSLEQFYASDSVTENAKQSRLQQIQDHFKKNVRPQLKTANYKGFGDEPLNNAVLISYKTYVMDLEEFENVFQRFKGDFKSFFTFAKSLEQTADPQKSFRTSN